MKVKKSELCQRDSIFTLVARGSSSSSFSGEASSRSSYSGSSLCTDGAIIRRVSNGTSSAASLHPGETGLLCSGPCGTFSEQDWRTGLAAQLDKLHLTPMMLVTEVIKLLMLELKALLRAYCDQQQDLRHMYGTCLQNYMEDLGMDTLLDPETQYQRESFDLLIAAWDAAMTDVTYVLEDPDREARRRSCLSRMQQGFRVVLAQAVSALESPSASASQQLAPPSGVQSSPSVQSRSLGSAGVGISAQFMSSSASASTTSSPSKHDKSSPSTQKEASTKDEPSPSILSKISSPDSIRAPYGLLSEEEFEEWRSEISLFNKYRHLANVQGAHPLDHPDVSFRTEVLDLFTAIVDQQHTSVAGLARLTKLAEPHAREEMRKKAEAVKERKAKREARSLEFPQPAAAAAVAKAPPGRHHGFGELHVPVFMQEMPTH